MPILLKDFQKTEVEGKLLKTFYEATTTLIPKSKTLQRKYVDSSLMNIDAKILNKLIKQMQQDIKRIINNDQVR